MKLTHDIMYQILLATNDYHVATNLMYLTKSFYHFVSRYNDTFIHRYKLISNDLLQFLSFVDITYLDYKSIQKLTGQYKKDYQNIFNIYKNNIPLNYLTNGNSDKITHTIINKNKIIIKVKYYDIISSSEQFDLFERILYEKSNISFAYVLQFFIRIICTSLVLHSLVLMKCTEINCFD
jgi:hypothetical protein